MKLITTLFAILLLISSIDNAYGDLHQWGRLNDGPQVRTSSITSIKTTTPVPNGDNLWDGLFITELNKPYDWLTPQDNPLWQSTVGINNLCTIILLQHKDILLNQESLL